MEKRGQRWLIGYGTAVDGATLTRTKIMSGSPPPHHHLLTRFVASEKRLCVRKTQAARTRTLRRLP